MNVTNQKGVDAFIQAYHFRRLWFMFGAPYKMALYVPADQVDAAIELLRPSELVTV